MQDTVPQCLIWSRVPRIISFIRTDKAHRQITLSVLQTVGSPQSAKESLRSGITGDETVKQKARD